MQLSGGQQQRVALARMLVLDPEVLLLDEPLSNLDAKLRLEMRAELKRIHGELKNTIVFVTHDQLEGMTLSTQIAVMKEALLQQFAPPMEVYKKPRNLFVAEFVGSPPINKLAVDDESCGQAAAKLLALFPGVADRVRTIGVRPEAFLLGSRPSKAGSREFRSLGRVEAVLPTGSEWIIGFRLCGAPFFALSTEDFTANPGDDIEVSIDSGRLLLFDAKGDLIEA